MAPRSNGKPALVAAAERLFAERGIEAVSLRDVSAAAGQRNHSAAQYHFGDRAGLVAAVYDARMSVVNEHRARLLDELDAAGRLTAEAGPSGPVEAIVLPLAALVTTTDGWYARFLARVRWDTFAEEVVSGLPVAAPLRRATRSLSTALRPLPVEVRRSRLDQLGTLTVGTLAGWEWARHRGARRLSAEVLGAELVVTALAVVGAPVADATAAPPRPSSFATA